MKGDRVEVVVDIGDGTRTFEIVATKAGRRVDVTIARGTVEVSEVTRTGQPVRSGRFMATRVVAMACGRNGAAAHGKRASGSAARSAATAARRAARQRSKMASGSPRSARTRFSMIS